MNDPVDLDYELIDIDQYSEERYRAVGLTNGGRMLSVVFTLRNGRLRAVIAFPAGAADTTAFLESAQAIAPVVRVRAKTKRSKSRVRRPRNHRRTQ